MIRFLAAILLVIVSVRADAQSVRIDCPTMEVLKIKAGLWQAQRIVSVATVTLPDETLTFPEFVIEATYVRGMFRRAVDPCVASGMSADGSVLSLCLPREPVVLVGFTPTAVEMTATGTLSRPTGKVYQAVVIYPSCPTSAIRGSFGRARLAAAVVATGTVSIP